MKRTTSVILILATVLALLLTACSGSSATTTTTTPTPTAVTSTAPGAPPGGAPPSGSPPGGNAPPGGGSTSASSGLSTATGAYTLDGGTATQTDQAYTASNQDQSAVYVLNGGALALVNPTITTSGNTSSNDNSSFYGLNAGVLATGGSQVTISGGTITTSGTGANGAFAQGSGSTVGLSNTTINATGNGGHGVMATNGGVVNLTNVSMTTAGKNSGVIATDRGGGTITASGGSVLASGQDSPALYSTGRLVVSDADLKATGAEAAVIEGANSIELTNCTLSSTFADKWGVMIYQSMSGDAEGNQGTFVMTGGSLAYTSATGPLFYVNNSTGVITLKGVAVTAGSGILIDASANSRWGTSGSNGGHVVLTGDAQTLNGGITADNISTLDITLLNGSALTGAINAAHTARTVSLTLDATSTWTVTANSYLTCLSNAAGISGTSITNITGNGHTVYYDAAACSALGGKTYNLLGGGTLTPVS